MCHFGNPFLQEAAAVLGKNPNVCADLSGLLEGRVELDRYFEEQAGYAGLLKKLAGQHLRLGPDPVRDGLAHRQSGGVHRLHSASGAGAALGGGVL